MVGYWFGAQTSWTRRIVGNLPAAQVACAFAAPVFCVRQG